MLPTIPSRDIDNDLKIGIPFKVEEDAYDYYKAYAVDKEFS